MDILTPYPRAANIQPRPPLAPPPQLTNHLITQSSCCPPFSIKYIHPVHPWSRTPLSSPRLSVWLVYVYLLSSLTTELLGLLWGRRRMLLSGISSSIHKCRLLRARRQTDLTVFARGRDTADECVVTARRQNALAASAAELSLEPAFYVVTLHFYQHNS